MLQAGTRLKDRYELQSVLGEGGMGFVYLALDHVLGGKKVAIKEMAVPRRSADHQSEALQQFREEAQLLATLEHPRLVPVSDFFEDSDKAYLVMAYIDGRTLGDEIAQREVPLTEITGWFREICDVLQYLHEHEPPVLFCDLKPSNLMLDRHGQVWLIDFGIARALEKGPERPAFVDGAVTAEFAPLEQFGEGGTDERSDIYSLGATMYHLVTGYMPPVSVEVVAGEAAPADPGAINPSLLPELEHIILKAMALRKEERYQSVRDLKADLDAMPLEAVQDPGLAASWDRQELAPSPAVPHSKRGLRRLLPWAGAERRSPAAARLVSVAILVLIAAALAFSRTSSRAENRISFTETVTPHAARGSVGVQPAEPSPTLEAAPSPERAQAPQPPPASPETAPADRLTAHEASRTREPAPPGHTTRDARPPAARDESLDDQDVPASEPTSPGDEDTAAVDDDTPSAPRPTTPREQASPARPAQTAQETAGPRHRFTNPYAPSANAVVPPVPRMRNPWAPSQSPRSATHQTPTSKLSRLAATRKVHKTQGHLSAPPHANAPTTPSGRTRSLDLFGVVESRNGRTALVRIGDNFRFVRAGSRLDRWIVIEFVCRRSGSSLVLHSNGEWRNLPLIPVTPNANVPRPPTADEIPITGPAGVVAQAEGRHRNPADPAFGEPPVDAADFNP